MRVFSGEPFSIFCREEAIATILFKKKTFSADFMPLKKDDALAYSESIIYFFTGCFFLAPFFSTPHPDIPALIREAVRDEQLVATGLLWLTLRTGSRHETVIPGRIAVIY